MSYVPVPQGDSKAYWNDASRERQALVNRMPGRTLFASAIENDATWYEGGTPQAPQGFSHKDRFGRLCRSSFNGGMGVGLPFESQADYGQVVIIADNDAMAANRAGSYAGLSVLTESINCKENSSPRGVESFFVKNNDSRLTVPGWAFYGEGHRLVAGPGNVYTAELESRNSVSLSAWNPYSTPGTGTVTLCLGSGCGLSPTGQFPSTAAIYITANPVNYAAGILFLDGSVGPHGINGSRPAIMLPMYYEIQWFKDAFTLAGVIRADPNGLQLDADALWLRLGGQMRRIVVDGNGFLKVA